MNKTPMRTTIAVTKEWDLYNYQWSAFCKNCWWAINTFSDKDKCPTCKLIITNLV